MSVLLAVILIIQSISLGWSIIEDQRRSIEAFALYLVFSFYLLLVAVRSVAQTTVDPHSESVWHLSSLSTFAAVLFVSMAVLPSSPPPVASSESFTPLPGFRYATVVLYVVLCLVSSTTPQGPPLHYPPEVIYSPRTVELITNLDHENVTGVVCELFLFFR